jgi:type III restriction/modification enzyme restriction subunit
MPRIRKTQANEMQADLFDLSPFLKTAPCVPALRKLVAEWRDGGYKGVTSTTRTLLNFWFCTDHRLSNGRLFKYHDAQREAIETLIYVYEVAQVRSRKDLLEHYAPAQSPIQLPGYDEFARYCTKMATGSGKTKVMALSIVQAMNHRVAGYVVLDVFARALKDRLIEQVEPTIEGEDRWLSRMEPFAFSRPVLSARKCVLNLVPCDNEFEYEFARFLDSAKDIVAFSKLPQQFGFSIEYTDNNANLRL